MKEMYCLLLVPLLCGCLLNNDPAALQESENFSGYFPLQLDNNWTYYATYNPESRVTYRVFGSRMIGQKEYFLFGSHEAYADTLRVDHSGRVWKYYMGREAVWLDPTRPDNSVYTYSDRQGSDFIYNVSVEKNIRVEAVADTFENCIRFFFDVPLVVDEEIIYTLARGRGIVRISGAWLQYTLLEAELN